MESPTPTQSPAPPPSHVLVVGAGALAHSLVPALAALGLRPQLQARQHQAAQRLAAAADPPLPIGPVGAPWAPEDEHSSAQAPEMVWLAVRDDAIAKLGERFRKQFGPNTLLVHSSGALPLEVLPGPLRARAYPFQTFSVGRSLPLAPVPLFYQGDPPSLQRLLPLARALFNRLHPYPQDNPTALHLAGVWANNFGAHLLAQAQELIRQADLPPELLEPLLQETLQKALALPPQQAQSGPARRGDLEAVLQHLTWLRAHRPELVPTYRELTRALAQRFGHTHLADHL